MARRRLLLLPALLVLAASCGGPGEDGPEVAVVVERVALDPGGNPVILLKERDGGRRLPIWVGIAEARSIAARLEQIEPPRPNTHDLTKRVVERLDARVERVVVTELRSRTYYGLIVMHGPDGLLRIDSRPSDAIALALRTDAPIFVARTLFEAESVPDDVAEPESAVPDSPREGQHAI